MHVATAILAKADVLHTYDRDHLLPLDKKIGVPALRIEEPSWEFQPQLAGLAGPVTAGSD